jgi:transcriptional regulator with XRE-family HTH domain
VRGHRHPDVAELIAQLKERRLSLGLQRCALAGQIGIDWSQLRKLEMGLHVPSIGIICSLAEALDLKVKLEVRLQ